MSEDKTDDTYLEIKKIAAYLELLHDPTDREATQLLKVEKQLARLLPAKKKIMKVITIH